MRTRERALPSDLRSQLSSAVRAARRAAEAGARASMAAYGVFADRKPEHLDAAQAALRNGLRAKWRQLGRDNDLLVAECAYEQWHRLLFARFLAENDLLLHPELEAPVTLDDCAELARELGEPDAWSVAARFAAEILPGIFRLDDPCVRLRFAPEGRHALERILDGLPRDVFLADDALGWVYQYWQKDKKDEVNRSERKIGGADLGPVTQLFTENYMVRFLLENSLGAWWAARHRESPLVKDFEYLRFDDDDGEPVGGTFDGWPDRAAEVTVMDPCCGSGHFLVEAFSMLWQMRAEEEGLSPVEAQDAVLRDNLFGLELDPRCVQIAMFAIVFHTWKVGGWRALPVPNVACSGLSARATDSEWAVLAEGDARLENALKLLHVMFRDAATLGSLIDPEVAVRGAVPSALSQTSIDDIEWAQLAPLLNEAFRREGLDTSHSVLGVRISGSAHAANLLGRRYTVVATNVPYRERRSLCPSLIAFIDRNHPLARFDLATAFVERIENLCRPGGSACFVVPQNWLFLTSYEDLRRSMLARQTINQIVWLGAGAFEEISGEVVKPVLAVMTRAQPRGDASAAVLDVSDAVTPRDKARLLGEADLTRVDQADQAANAGSRILFEPVSSLQQLKAVADSLAGMMTSDSPRFTRCFWELPAKSDDWEFFQSTTSSSSLYSGLSQVIYWQRGSGVYRRYVDANRHKLGGAPLRGRAAWGKRGVAVSQIGDLPVAPYCGTPFDNNVAVIVPKLADDLGALWAFCSSREFTSAVRKLDRKLNVTNATLGDVPFDLERWRQVAAEAGPLPEPWSDDPTQWLFEGRPEVSTAPLQVAVGRLVGYRWPEQAESDELDRYADADGIVCLPAVAEEQPAADRLQELLGAAFGTAWSPTKVKQLLEQTGSKKKTVAEWLRDDFFRQQCALFQNRPFVWHVWDGCKDGFSALVNYHRLDHGKLQKLTYTYLGQDWMERVQGELRDEVPGADARLAAAVELKRKLELILEGERPYDVCVRWKELHEQPIGWHPDLHDGVRLNIRPFVRAGVLRATPNVKWTKDRGRNPDGSERLNDIHLTLAEKRAARKQGGT